jgi:pyrroloquinoline quinone biosynthesis protein D
VKAKVRTSSLALGCRPQLREGMRLRYDGMSGRQVLLFPEGILQLNSTAASVLMLCDGQRSVREIIAALAATFEAPREVLFADVAEYLLHLCDRHLLQFLPEEVP